MKYLNIPVFCLSKESDAFSKLRKYRFTYILSFTYFLNMYTPYFVRNTQNTLLFDEEMLFDIHINKKPIALIVYTNNRSCIKLLSFLQNMKHFKVMLNVVLIRHIYIALICLWSDNGYYVKNIPRLRITYAWQYTKKNSWSKKHAWFNTWWSTSWQNPNTTIHSYVFLLIDTNETIQRLCWVCMHTSQV